MLDDPDELGKKLLRRWQEKDRGTSLTHLGDLHCGRCGGTRRMNGCLAYRTPPAAEFRKQPLAIAFLQCSQCDAHSVAIWYDADHVPEGGASVVLPLYLGCAATPRTPPAVKYYLDQAHKAHSFGANSAAVAMYRAALEHVLYGQGYTVSLLGKKLAALQEARSANTAPPWARELNPEFLNVINKLGNEAIHPNDGDISRQAALDDALVRALKATFAHLLEVIYEQEPRRMEHLQTLQAALNPQRP